MYEVVSSYYDEFMRGDDSEWIEFALNNVRGLFSGVDMGCGSGKVTAALSKDHRVIGVDASPRMLDMAEKRCRSVGSEVTLVMDDAENFCPPTSVNFVTAMCDVVNYLRFPEKFFSKAYEYIERGGKLVFDISSEKKLKKILGNNVYTDTVDSVTYIWENSLFKDYVRLDLTFFVPHGELYQKKTETQIQYIHSAKKLTESLEKIGFSVTSYDKGDRVYFVATKD